MKKQFLYSLLIVALLSLCSCGSHKTVAYSATKTTCIATELDGSYTLRVEGRGRNAADAYNEAGKQAVYDMLFTTIVWRSGATKNIQPIFVTMKRAYTDNRTYFNQFFADGGEYENYMSMKEKRELSNIYHRTNAQTVCVTTVCVYRDRLVEKMIADGILGK